MIKNLWKKSLITLLVLTSMSLCAKAESLFTLGASQTYAPIPKSLYGGVQARSVGDLISIILDESFNVTNNIKYTSNKESSTSDNFSKFLNTMLGKHWVNDNLGTYCLNR